MADTPVVSQFTLHASTKKGTRPSFIRAAGPGEAESPYTQFLALLEAALGRPPDRGDGHGRLFEPGDIRLVVELGRMAIGAFPVGLDHPRHRRQIFVEVWIHDLALLGW